jgi:2-polyprenyl-3-methyl-5-hydroxy-6-metoxy-1,4-benzoquinol methylase
VQTNSKLETNSLTLLNTCTCGNVGFHRERIEGIDILNCSSCGIRRQDLPGYTEEMYFNFYQTKYHTEEQEKIGLQSYADRYKHDFKIAAMRHKEYKDTLEIKKGKALDIGSSNNAFVDYMNLMGFTCRGIEIGEEGHKHPETTYTKDLLELDLNESIFDLITLHDVFEHLICPQTYLKEIKRILKPGAFMILDLPNYFVPEGVHHWRPVQHLWFFNEEQTKQLIEENGFQLLAIKEPIPSKIVFYCRKI